MPYVRSRRAMAAVASSTFASISAPPLRRVRDAVPQMLLQELEREGLQGLGGGGDLGEYVDAVDVLVDHPLEAADLALDPAQPLEVLVLLLVVAVHAVRRGGARSSVTGAVYRGLSAGQGPAVVAAARPRWSSSASVAGHVP